MKLQFAMIDIKKNQDAASKNQHDRLDIHNEIRLIIASDKVHNLWKEVISNHSEGLLIDLVTLQPMKDTKNWDRERDGVLSREFFKWMGNTTEDDLRRLAVHLLNKTPGRTYPHPKVTVKKLHAVIPDCYSAGMWLESVKRKQAVRKYLWLEKRSLGFFGPKGNYRKEAWKSFKEKYNITPATKQLLFTAPKEEFFLQAKRPSRKNKKCKDLSPYAAKFFKVFLRSKGKYRKPEARIFMRSYSFDNDLMGEWANNAWDESTNKSIKLAVLDFRNIPGVLHKSTAPKDSPYYEEFMETTLNLTDPSLMDPQVWLWITGDQEVDDQVRGYIRNGDIAASYASHYALYIPTVPAEGLYDLNPSSAVARAPVSLIFLIKRKAQIKQRSIPRRFEVPVVLKWSKAGAVNELEYRIYDTELRMEFYLGLIDLFCDAREEVYSIYVGGKFLCTAWVSSLYSLHDYQLESS